MLEQLLIALIVVNVLLIVALCFNWWRNDNLAQRVATLEAHRLSTDQVLGIYNRLGTIEGRLETTVKMMQTIQEHLLENDP